VSKTSKEIKAEAGARVLFLDMEAVEKQQNVVQRVSEAKKHPSNPVLRLGDLHEWDSLQARPWESRTVIYDEEEGLFKCWYAGTDLTTDRWWATGYAVSEDGVNWVKPRLGLYEYNGNTDNNICLPGWGPVLKDGAEEDPEKRYKLVWKGPRQFQDASSYKGLGARAAYSGDGMHWKEGPRIEIPEWKGGAPDIVVLLRDDQDPDPQRKYKLVWQTTGEANKPGPEKVRTKCLAYGPDIEHFTASKANPILNPNDGLEQENHFLMLAPYRGWYVMLYEYGWYMPNGTGNFGSYSADIRLAVSRDGEHYQRVQPHQKVISRGRRGEWDNGFLVISDKPVIKDDTIYLYYAGNGEDWTSWPGGNIPPGFRFASSGCVRRSQMGLATLRLDGFTCLETTDGETPGFATTCPIDSAPRDVKLVVNLGDTQQRRSWLAVEVLDAGSNEPLPGMAREDCLPVHRDGICVPVTWKDKSLADSGVSRFKLRFWLHGAVRLYAFGFEKG